MHNYPARPNNPRAASGAARPPVSVLIVFAGLATSLLITGFRFAVAIVKARRSEEPTASTAVVVVSVIMVALIFIMSATAIRHGWKAGAAIVTLVSLWGAGELIWYGDPLSILTTVSGLVATFAAWTPLARVYGREIRLKRLAAARS